MHIIIGNYGNESIALLQWSIEQTLAVTYFVSIDTGWSAPSWQQRLQQGQAYAGSHGIISIHLKPKKSFAELVQLRNEFPNKKFQWCASLLKGMVILDWLDEVDPGCQATIMLAKYRQQSRAKQQLPELIAGSEHYLGRRLWHPLYLQTRQDISHLIARAGFEKLPHKSLECSPCIHSSRQDLQTLSASDQLKTQRLESAINQKMFIEAQYSGVDCQGLDKPYEEYFDMGCGSPWGCGE